MQFTKSPLSETMATFVIVLIVLILRQIARRIIKKHSNKYDLASERSLYINKFFNFTLTAFLLVALGFIWDFSFKEVFFSFFAVAGVALFASWSMLSNMTASVILFFNFPFKIGSKIKIVDGDNSIIGEVKDITFFTIQIELENKDMVSYPNNVAIQKPIIQLHEETIDA